MNTLNLTESVADEAITPLLGSFALRDHYTHGIDESCRVNKPNGEPLGILVRNALDSRLCYELMPILRDAARLTDNRGIAAGPVTLEEVARSGGYNAIALRGGRAVVKKKDGTISKRTRSKKVHSGIVGYVDGNTTYPYCRMTAWTMENFGPMMKCMPLITAADEVLKKHLPERHAAQMAVAQRTAQDFRLGNTSFTTVTVNRNFRTAYHTDKGDLKAGFGVLCCLRRGDWNGGLLVLPKYKCAFNMRHGDVLLVDVHEVHGNTAMIPRSRSWERITCVFYYRERVAGCGTAEQELAKAKATK